MQYHQFSHTVISRLSPVSSIYHFGDVGWPRVSPCSRWSAAIHLLSCQAVQTEWDLPFGGIIRSFSSLSNLVDIQMSKAGLITDVLFT